MKKLCTPVQPMLVWSYSGSPISPHYFRFPWVNKVVQCYLTSLFSFFIVEVFLFWKLLLLSLLLSLCFCMWPCARSAPQKDKKSSALTHSVHIKVAKLKKALLLRRAALTALCLCPLQVLSEERQKGGVFLGVVPLFQLSENRQKLHRFISQYLYN